MDDNGLLLALLAIPAGGAIVGALLPGKVAKYWALLVSLATLVVAIGLNCTFFNRHQATLFYGRNNPLKIETIGISFSLFVDSISLWLVLLTAVLTPLSILFSFASIRTREKEYYAWMLVLLMAMLGVFVSADLLLFYIFFELTLIPMFFIIGIWGWTEKREAAGKFFLFTFAGSVFTLAAIIYLGIMTGNQSSPVFALTQVVEFAQGHLSQTARFWVAMGLLVGFAVKVPLFPLHTWLPLAHTEAPTAGSVILAGVLLKLGTYGLLRLALPIGLLSSGGVAFPHVISAIGVICVIGVLYGALVAWVQKDIKKLVAYSSVSHLGFCILGLMALNDIGMQGSVLYMINHGISTGAMFLVIGMIYDRYHTRDIDQLSGLARKMPKMAFFFILFTLASIGLPGTNGFVNEFLTILGAFTSTHLGPVYAVVAALGVILGAVYMLHMAARVIWGPLKVPEHEEHEGHEGSKLPVDLSLREISVLVPLAIVVFALGFLPNVVLKSIEAPVHALQPRDGKVSVQVHKALTLPSPGVPGEGVRVGAAAVAEVNR